MSILEFLQKGGPVVIVLLVVSLIGFTVAIERLLVFLSVLSDLRNLEGRESRELEEAAGYDGTVVENWLNRLLATCRDPKGTEAQFKTRFGALEDTLALRLGLLSFIPRVAVLLGLLGTVLGLIHAFVVAEKMGNNLSPAALGGAISEALFATATGLGVAISTWFLHWLLEGWLEGLVKQGEHLVVDNPDLFKRFLGEEGQVEA